MEVHKNRWAILLLTVTFVFAYSGLSTNSMAAKTLVRQLTTEEQQALGACWNNEEGYPITGDGESDTMNYMKKHPGFSNPKPENEILQLGGRVRIKVRFMGPGGPTSVRWVYGYCDQRPGHVGKPLYDRLSIKPPNWWPKR